MMPVCSTQVLPTVCLGGMGTGVSGTMSSGCGSESITGEKGNDASLVRLAVLGLVAFQVPTLWGLQAQGA